MQHLFSSAVCGSFGESVVAIAALFLLANASPVAHAQATVGGGTLGKPAVGPSPTYKVDGSGFVLVKNWDFGTKGTIKNIADMSANFLYHDQFNQISNGSGNYGAVMVAPDTANAISGQPVEGPGVPKVRQFTADSLKTFLVPLKGVTTVTPIKHDSGCGSFMAKWTLPKGGSLLGQDILWETRVRMVTPPYFWFAIWTAGNKWQQGAEHDLVEAFGYDNGGGNTNFEGRFWHSNSVGGADVTPYGDWSKGMAEHSIRNFDATKYHTWSWLYKADNTYAMYVDGVLVQHGKSPYPWTLGAKDGAEPLSMYFLFDGSWAHTKIDSVNKPLPSSAFDGKYYEWDYSRVYLRPGTARAAIR